MILVLLLWERCRILKSASRRRRSSSRSCCGSSALITRLKLSPSAICWRSTAISTAARARLATSDSSRAASQTLAVARRGSLPVGDILIPFPCGLLLAALVAEFLPQQAGGVVGYPAQPLFQGLSTFGLLGSEAGQRRRVIRGLAISVSGG